MTYKSVFISLLITLLAYIAIGVSRADDITISTCDFASLQSAIRDANGLDEAVIQFDCDGTISFTTQISITGDIHLIGNDAITFDGTGRTRLFYVAYGASFTLENVTIQNGYATEFGGAIFSHNGTLTIMNSTFTGNSAHEGGAIFNYDSTLSITNSTFTGNSAHYSGAIYNAGTLTIDNSTFTDNLADFESGAIINYGRLTISNSTLSGNSANQGGAIFNHGRLTISDSTFTGNSADVGGAIYNNEHGTLTISTSTFTDNSADVGGAIFNNKNGTATSQDTLYENNTCSGVITDNGGNTGMNARGCPSDTPVSDDTGDVTINTCDFATLQSAVSIANSGGGTISITCTGAIIFEDELKIIADNVLIQNDSGGEVIFDETGDDNRFFRVRDGASLTLNGFTLQNGNAFGGGAIESSGTLTISNSTFRGNSAERNGGAIANFGTLTISDSTFTDNSTTDYGGAIFNSVDGTLTISNSMFRGNSVDYSGGAIDNYGRLTITNSTFTDNSAGFGGAIFNNENGTATSQDTHYENNTCLGAITDNGGNTGMNARGCPSDTPANDDTGDATISTCDFATLQTAVYIANSGGGTISITCTGTIIFEDNLSIADTVVIQNDSGGEVIFDGTGYDNGFFLVVIGASFTLNGFTLQNGNDFNGGAIFNDDNGTLTIINSTFIGNSADIYGGAIVNDDNGTLTIINSTFIGNSASRYGGVVFNDRRGMMTIINSTFTDNSADIYGGAIFNDRRGTLTIINSTFTGNSVSRGDGDGGAIYNLATATSQNTHYENNTCAGDITDFGGNRAENAEGCPQS